MAIYRLGNDTPVIPPTAFVHEAAIVIGMVTLGARSSVWPGAVLRGDNEPIVIGEASNVQDGAVLHTDPGCPLTLGDYVSVGHQAMLHGCSVGAGTLIGIQAIVMNLAVIGRESIVGAGAIVTEGKRHPDRALLLGAPAKLLRTLTDEDVLRIRGNAEAYALRQDDYKKRLVRIG